MCIEDRYPGGIPRGLTRDDLLHNTFLEDVEPEVVNKRVHGPIAFIFGRMTNSKSICVRIEGVFPKLFFSYDGTDLQSLRLELSREVSEELRNESTGLKLQMMNFCNFNGYEPDDTTASGREIHSYIQVEYPSMRAYRKAANLRKEEEESINNARKQELPIPIRKYRIAHEINVHPVTRFIRDVHLVPGGWVSVRGEDPGIHVSSCDEEVYVVQKISFIYQTNWSRHLTAYFTMMPKPSVWIQPPAS